MLTPGIMRSSQARRRRGVAGNIGLLLLTVSVLVAGCTGDSDAETPTTLLPAAATTMTSLAPVTSAADSTTPTTQSPATTTMAPQAAVVEVGFYQFGADGLFRVVYGEKTLLVDEPVAEVWDDHLGGVLFEYGFGSTFWGDRHWLKADSELPQIAAHWGFTGVVGGDPTVFYGVGDTERCDGELFARSLSSGNEHFVMCLPWEDTYLGIESTGGGLLVGAVWDYLHQTSRGIGFWDMYGRSVALRNNPFPETCAPCELTALISPGGGLLAYRYRPDSPWLEVWESAPDGVWWEQSRHIPAEVAVHGLASGEKLWSVEVPADVDLADFDGRYLVTTTDPSAGSTQYGVWDAVAESVIYDTWSSAEPLVIKGRVKLVREPAEVVDLPPETMPLPGEDMWLVAGVEGVALMSRDGAVSAYGEPAGRAFPDGQGGLVFQTPDQGGAHLFVEQDGRNIFNPDYPASVIYWVPEPGSEPIPLTVSGVDPAAEVAGVIEVGDRTSVVYSTLLPGCSAADFPNDPGWWELGCGVFRSWVAQDLVDGDKINLGQGGACGFECGRWSLSVGPMTTSAKVEGYGEVTPSFYAIDTEGLLAQGTAKEPDWRNDPPISASKGWIFDMSTYCIQNCSGISAVAAPAPDGSTILVAWTREITSEDAWALPFDGLRLTLLDTTTGAILDELEVPTLFPLWLTAMAVPVWLDFDGRKAIIGLEQRDRHQTPLSHTSPLLVDMAARTIEVLEGPGGHVTFWLPHGS